MQALYISCIDKNLKLKKSEGDKKTMHEGKENTMHKLLSLPFEISNISS